MAFSSSSNPQGAPTRFSQFDKSELIIPATGKWSISKDHKILDSTFSKHHYNYLNRYATFTEEFCIRHAEKLHKAQHVLREVGRHPAEGLVMTDAIQRLGIDYYFKEEIEEILQRQYQHISTTLGHDKANLHDVSLGFRLLRQQDYHVPADIFNKFKDIEGKFAEKLVQDIKGLMGLYEASQLNMEGEEALEEAGNFSSKVLSAWLANLDHQKARVVKTTLENPYHKTLPRFMAKIFLTNFQGRSEWINVLQEVAKLDSSMVKSVHQMELLQVSKWWKDLGLGTELKFARNQPIKWYMWAMAVLTDPSLSKQRIEMTKPTSLIYIIDDIFDLYGKPDELTLFTDAVNRWDLDATEQLPDYMKTCFKALYDTTNEISCKIYRESGWNPIESLRLSWGRLCNAFLVEARWFASGHLPKAEEYLKNGIVSTGVHVFLVHLFFLVGEGITKQSVESLNNMPSIISSTATILRLWDDLGSAEDENQDGHDGSYLNYYMNEHQASTMEGARAHVMDKISDAWKNMNQECLSSQSLFSPSFRKSCLNVARMVPLMYNYDEEHNLPALEEHMRSLLSGNVSM